MDRICWLWLILASLISGAAQAGGLTEQIRDCDACHGPAGVSSNPEVPNIAGMSALYLSESMIAYQDAVRPCPKATYPEGSNKAATDMCKISMALSESQIEGLAAYYAKQQHVPAKQAFDPRLADRGGKVHDLLCEKCHADGGLDPDDDAGVLAGQWMPYLQDSFADYRSGARKMVDNMAKKFEKLDDEDVQDLIHFYASQQ